MAEHDAEAARKKKHEIVRKEMERKANDEIKVHNPTGKDYFVRWGGYYWKIPDKTQDNGNGKGNAIVPRYIAKHYTKNIVTDLIYAESAKVVAAAKKKYTGNFWPGEEERIALRTNNPQLVKKYTKLVVVGLHRKFGMEELPEELQAESDKLKDRRPLGEVLFDEVLEEGGGTEVTTTAPPDELVKNAPTKAKTTKTKTDKEEFVKAIEDNL